MKRFVEVTAIRFAVPIETAITIAEPQAPQQPAGSAGVGNSFHRVLHLFRTDKTKFTHHIGLLALCQGPILMDGFSESSPYPETRIMMRGDDIDVRITERFAM